MYDHRIEMYIDAMPHKRLIRFNRNGDYTPSFNKFIEFCHTVDTDIEDLFVHTHKQKLAHCYNRLNEMGIGYVIAIVHPGKSIIMETFNEEYIL